MNKVIDRLPESQGWQPCANYQKPYFMLGQKPDLLQYNLIARFYDIRFDRNPVGSMVPVQILTGEPDATINLQRQFFMKHWTEFLPEASAIRLLENDQMMLSDRIDHTSLQLKELKRQYAENESGILEQAINDWSAEEIEKAKRKAGFQPK